MGIQKSDKCVFCKTSPDDIDYMLLYCPIIIELWNIVEEWIVMIDFVDYNLNDRRKY